MNVFETAAAEISNGHMVSYELANALREIAREMIGSSSLRRSTGGEVSLGAPGGSVRVLNRTPEIRMAAALADAILPDGVVLQYIKQCERQLSVILDAPSQARIGPALTGQAQALGQEFRLRLFHRLVKDFPILVQEDTQLPEISAALARGDFDVESLKALGGGPDLRRKIEARWSKYSARALSLVPFVDGLPARRIFENFGEDFPRSFPEAVFENAENLPNQKLIRDPDAFVTHYLRDLWALGEATGASRITEVNLPYMALLASLLRKAPDPKLFSAHLGRELAAHGGQRLNRFFEARDLGLHGFDAGNFLEFLSDPEFLEENRATEVNLDLVRMIFAGFKRAERHAISESGLAESIFKTSLDPLLLKGFLWAFGNKTDVNGRIRVSRDILMSAVDRIDLKAPEDLDYGKSAQYPAALGMMTWLSDLTPETGAAFKLAMVNRCFAESISTAPRTDFEALLSKSESGSVQRAMLLADLAPLEDRARELLELPWKNKWHVLGILNLIMMQKHPEWSGDVFAYEIPHASGSRRILLRSFGQLSISPEDLKAIKASSAQINADGGIVFRMDEEPHICQMALQQELDKLLEHLQRDIYRTALDALDARIGTAGHRNYLAERIDLKAIAKIALQIYQKPDSGLNWLLGQTPEKSRPRIFKHLEAMKDTSVFDEFPASSLEARFGDRPDLAPMILEHILVSPFLGKDLGYLLELEEYARVSSVEQLTGLCNAVAKSKNCASSEIASMLNRACINPVLLNTGDFEKAMAKVSDISASDDLAEAVLHVASHMGRYENGLPHSLQGSFKRRLGAKIRKTLRIAEPEF